MTDLNNTVLSNVDLSVFVTIPSQQLLDQSLYVTAQNKRFNDWSTDNHANSYTFMQRIAHAWKTSNFTNQYLIYGKIDSNLFKWEIVPYQKCRTFIGRIVQQLVVLWRTVFGGIVAAKEKIKSQFEKYQSLLKTSKDIAEPSNVANKDTDSFCKQATIDSQWVMKGKTVNVLFNYAPIGFGGEKLHFLIVPKEHREAFTDVTKEEYCESLALTTKLVDHFTQTRKVIKNVYLLNKTGVDAGQTVKHWHLHAIFSTNAAQDFWGKLTVVKNILFGSSPMKKDDLTKKIDQLRAELSTLP